MPRRRYAQLNRMSERLARRLNRLVVWVRSAHGNRGRHRFALMQAHQILEEYFVELIAFTYRVHVKRDLHRRKGVVDLSYADTQMLRLEVDRKLEEFKRILDDVK